MPSFDEISQAMLIPSGRLHASLCALASRLEMVEDAMGEVADAWNDMYHAAEIREWPDYEFGEDYDEDDHHWALEGLSEALQVDINEKFGFVWRPMWLGRSGGTVVPTASPGGLRPRREPVISVGGDYPHSIDAEDIVSKNVTVEDGLTTLGDMEHLLDELSWFREGPTGAVPTPYFAAASVVFDEVDEQPDDTALSKIELFFSGGLEPGDASGFVEKLIELVEEYSMYAIETVVELETLTAAFRYWIEFCERAANGLYAAGINYIVESRKEDESGETEEEAEE